MKMLTVSALVCAMMVLTGAAESHLVKRSVPCSSGWFPINGRWFRFVPNLMTWAKAEQNCQSLGGNLASIHSLQEYQQIQKLTDVHTWVGGSDAEEENQWFWSNGSPFNYKSWCSGEPNGARKQNCLQINHTGEKCWDDCECSIERASLCVRAN